MAQRNRKEQRARAALRQADREKAATRKAKREATARRKKRDHAAKLEEVNPCKTFHDSHQQEGSRLMSLPGELRNRIYALALPGPYITVQHYLLGTMPDITTAPALLLTCKRIHQEAIGIYYSSTIFLNQPSHLLKPSERNDDLEKWLRGIGSARVCRIQHIWTDRWKVGRQLFSREEDGPYDTIVETCLDEIAETQRLAESICHRPVWGTEVVKTSLEFELHESSATIWTCDPEKLCANIYGTYYKGSFETPSAEFREFLFKQSSGVIAGMWIPSDHPFGPSRTGSQPRQSSTTFNYCKLLIHARNNTSSTVVTMTESRVGTSQKHETLARRAKLLRAHQFARTLANQVIHVPQEEAAVTPTTASIEPNSEPTPSRANPHQHSCPNQDFESNGFASFESADEVPPAPSDEQQITCDLAGLKLDSVPDMLVHAKQQEDSRLMLLPAELRNHIYALALDGLELTLHDYRHVDVKLDESFKLHLQSEFLKVSFPSILLTCKRIYDEAIGIYFSTTKFSFPPCRGGDQIFFNQRLKRWLTSIGYELASQIKDINVTSTSERTVNLHPQKADGNKGVEDCVKDIEAVRSLAEDIYGRPVWGSEVVKSRLVFGTWHDDVSIWSSDPVGLCAEAFAAYDFGSGYPEVYTLDNVYKWNDFLKKYDNCVRFWPYPSPEEFTEWAHKVSVTQNPWCLIEQEWEDWRDTGVGYGPSYGEYAPTVASRSFNYGEGQSKRRKLVTRRVVQSGHA
ncbi:hypothetical protein CB0940_01919 [Cercospora beticola]|uniref:Uncharacterized protein n=1 Tax=Cercospora beticola TaxID=122368 RepID=A0A2G5IBP3_CERBT|nr:hypothetical protein CB0940_01919 [Cercospora beticola]PIB02191.1 hypothetical protein CB0940_01919 [Cercospora beticola]WPA97381.1 hypothetical protein RHO25_001990 [Cercospora beticola]